MAKKVIPNESGPNVEIGDKVHVTTKEGEEIVAEVVSFVEGSKNWIKEVRIKSKDGFTFLEVKDLTVHLIKIVTEILESTLWSKIKEWWAERKIRRAARKAERKANKKKK